MAKDKKQSEEVVEVEAEEMPVSVVLQESINQEVKRFDPYEARMNELREKYSGLKIASPSDKEGIEQNRLAIADLRTIRVNTEKERKQIKAPFLKAAADIEAKAQWIISEVGKIEEPLKAQKKEIQEEMERIATEEKERILKRNKIRTAQLSDMGAVFNGVDYVLGDVAYSFDIISSTDADIYDEKILPKYREVFEKNELDRLEQEHLQKQKEASEKAEREAFEAEQKKFREQQERLRKDQERIEKEKRESEERARIFKAQQEEKIWRSRLAELEDIGWNGECAFDKEDNEVFLSYNQLIDLGQDEFEIRRDNWNTMIGARKEALQKEKDRLAEEAEEKRIAEFERQKELAVQKALNEQKEKERLTEVDRLEKLEVSNDKVKYAETINYLKATPIYEMRSGQYRAKMRIINDFLADLK